MKYNIRKNWIDAFGLMVKNPVVLLPFAIVAFLEGLALELIYFSPRKPLAYVVNPLVKKYFGGPFVHYPANMIILPKLFYYAQVLIYVLVGVLLTAICVNMVRNIKAGLPLKMQALVRNNLKRYLSFFAFGLMMVSSMFLVKKIDGIIFAKVINALSARLPQTLLKLSPFILNLALFFSNVILQTFLVLIIPIIVIKKKMFLKALGEGIVLSLRNFLTVFTLIFLPLLVYLPIVFLKIGAPVLMEKTFPEVNLYITIAGMILTIFAECFIIVCATQFVLDKMTPIRHES